MHNPYRQITVSRLAARQRRARWEALLTTDPRWAVKVVADYHARRERKRLNRERGRLLRLLRRGVPMIPDARTLAAVGRTAEQAMALLAEGAQRAAISLSTFATTHSEAMGAFTHHSRARSGSGSAPAESEGSHE